VIVVIRKRSRSQNQAPTIRTPGCRHQAKEHGEKQTLDRQVVVVGVLLTCAAFEGYKRSLVVQCLMQNNCTGHTYTARSSQEKEIVTSAQPLAKGHSRAERGLGERHREDSIRPGARSRQCALRWPSISYNRCESR